MGRSPGACSAGARAAVINKGPWTEAEDEILSAHVKAHGEGNWRLVPKLAGLSRCGKSCRLRWINYLRPNLKRGNFSVDEDNLILTLHALLGNRWSLIAGRIPGRTDNEIKNYWNTHLRRKLRSMGIDPTSYKVGLTLTSITNQEPDLHANAFDVPSSSSSPPQIQATTTTTTTTTTMEFNSHLVSSSGDSTSTSTSYDSASATSNSEPDSSSPTGVSILAEQLLEPWMHLQVPISLNSQPLGSNSGFGWSHEQMQLLDPLDLSGVLQPLESLLVHNEVPWTSSFFDSLVE